MKLPDRWLSTDSGAPSLKSKALRLLGLFLLLMLGCTLLSRAADSITMPQVTAEKSTRSAIAHTVRADGVLGAGRETLITVADGILVDRIEAGEGQPVQLGDPILTLNADSLSRRIRAEATAFQKLKLELAAQQSTEQYGGQKETLTYDRAYEDYSYAFDHSYKEVDDARIARAEALAVLREYYNANKETIDRYTGAAAPGASSLDNTVMTKYYRLQSDYESADARYNAAKDNRKDSWTDAERSLQDAKLALDFSTANQAAIIGLTLAMQEETVKELERLRENGGAVCATIDGVVSRIAVEPGSATTQSAVAMVAQKDGGFRLTAEVTQDELKYLEHGGAATVYLPSGRPQKGTVSSLHGQTVTVLLPEDVGELGERATIEFVQKTDNYNCCLPMSALRSDGNQMYVMRLQETDTVLGTQLVAERVDVQVEDRNETRAAVSGAIMESDRVIVSSTKPVREGDRVRLLTP